MRRLAENTWRCPVRGTFLLAIVIAMLGGCALFDTPPGLYAKKELPPLQPAPDAIQLDIVYVERPIGDALLGPTLWRHIDQVSVQTETRGLSRQNGLRVGVSGSRPPEALQTLLGLKADYLYEPEAEKSKQLVGHHIPLRSGGTTEIQTNPTIYPECSVKIHDAGDKIRTREFKKVRCVYQVTAQRVQDGWVRLDFVPQIQQVSETMRADFGEAGVQYTSDPKIAETFYPQRFSVTLGIGEMAVLSAEDNAPESLGRLFFVGPTEDSTVQRLLVVRLSDMRNIDDPYAK